MKSVACFVCLGALALAGCNPSQAPPADVVAPVAPGGGDHAPSAGDSGNARLVATIAGQPITLGDLMQPLIEAHGLTTLLQLVELDLAKQLAAKQNLTVTAADIEHERQITLDQLYQQTDDKMQADIDDATARHDTKRLAELQEELGDQHAILLTQFLDNQHIALSEFNTAMEINAYLRKLAAPSVDEALTPEVLQRAFNQQFGERVRVRYIQLSNLEQVTDAKRRLLHEDFSDVAREMSQNVASRELGGELPPFSQKDSNFPQAFRDAAFALKVGEVSDAVEYKDAYYLIKLEERLPPVAVKFDDVKDSLRKTLYENIMQQAVKSMRDRLGGLAVQEMQIDDPTMKKQYDDRKAQQEAQVRDEKRAKEEMEAEHHRLWDKIDASTQPGAGATTAPAATQP